MSTDFALPDSLSLDDLHTFLSRAVAVDDGAVRLIVANGVLAAYVGVLSPAGLLDASPTVLGLRTFAVAGPQELDVVVSLRSLLERVVRLRNEVVDPTAAVTIPVPPTVITASWAAISPPRGGWVAKGSLGGAELESVAKAGIEEVAGVLPAGTGEQIVQRVRSGVWSRPVEGSDVPAGAAFAALTLGFLMTEEPARVFSVGAWTRLSTSRGHVLVKRRSSLL